MSTITTYYLRKIDGKIYDSEVITEGKTTPMTEDQILFIENYIHKTQEVTLLNNIKEKHYYSYVYNGRKEEIIVKQLTIITLTQDK